MGDDEVRHDDIGGCQRVAAECASRLWVKRENQVERLGGLDVGQLQKRHDAVLVLHGEGLVGVVDDSQGVVTDFRARHSLELHAQAVLQVVRADAGRIKASDCRECLLRLFCRNLDSGAEGHVVDYIAYRAVKVTVGVEASDDEAGRSLDMRAQPALRELHEQLVIEVLRVVDGAEHIVVGAALRQGIDRIAACVLLGGLLLDAERGIILKLALDSLVEFGRVEFQQPYET